MPTINETRNQMIQFVFPEHTNNLGTLHGGRLMDWIMLLGSITSSRFAKCITVLGTTDSIDFINPVRLGEIVILDSWVEYVGNSSIEVGVKVHSENLVTGEKRHTTSSHMAFVAVDSESIPKIIHDKITPADKAEEAIYLEAQKRRGNRIPRIREGDKAQSQTLDSPGLGGLTLQTTKPVLPEDTFYGNLMSVGKLMKDIDETAAVLASRFVRGIMVTGSVDDLYFYSPIFVGDIITFSAIITYVGKASLEVQIKVIAENLISGVEKHTCTAFLTFVHLGPNGKPLPVPKFTPESPEERTLWKNGEERRLRRMERLKNLRKAADSATGR